jgi:hypothetical protein
MSSLSFSGTGARYSSLIEENTFSHSANLAFTGDIQGFRVDVFTVRKRPMSIPADSLEAIVEATHGLHHSGRRSLIPSF